MVEKNRTLVTLIRLAMAVALFVGVSWPVADRVAHNVFRPTEYFAYFTILSCTLSAVVLTLSAIKTFRGEEESVRFSTLRLIVVTSMVIVGVIYNLLLADAAPDIRDIGYVAPTGPNLIMHVYMPILIFIEWIFFDSTAKLKITRALWVLIYPLIWLVLTMLRGSFTDGWWPYWFLDPKEGVGTVLTWIAVIFAFFLLLAPVLLLIQRAVAGLYRKNR